MKNPLSSVSFIVVAFIKSIVALGKTSPVEDITRPLIVCACREIIDNSIPNTPMSVNFRIGNQ
ncbi:hypothetical protein [Rhizosphaericola mali]|uniref:hypothetical protein n=1 Tax=Rhizosphaericola mali TaxID=2545455 RepID=UPI001CD94B05|nr:hypothetical protein [Rhizosphaericola mali]